MPKDIHGRRRIGARSAGLRTGAVAAGVGDRRRRGLGWLWRLLLLALVAALILWLALRHRGDTGAGAVPSTSPAHAVVGAPLSPTAGASTTGSASTAAGPSSSATTSADVPTSTPTATATSATTAPADGGSASVGGGAVAAHEIRNAPSGEVGTILFATGSASMDTQGRAALAAVAAHLRALGAKTVTVTGFANEPTTPGGNTALAQARVTAVASALRADLAGTRTTVRTLAVGQTDPAAAETTAAGRLADARTTVSVPGAALIGGDGVPVHPAAGSAALPADAIGVTLFHDSSAALDTADRAVVDAAAEHIRAAHSRSVVVTGYTDSVGGAAGALTLSHSRAQAVADALRDDLGAAAPTITIRTVGERNQIASDATADGRRLNRRVVITSG